MGERRVLRSFGTLHELLLAQAKVASRANTFENDGNSEGG